MLLGMRGPSGAAPAVSSVPFLPPTTAQVLAQVLTLARTLTLTLHCGGFSLALLHLSSQCTIACRVVEQGPL